MKLQYVLLLVLVHICAVSSHSYVTSPRSRRPNFNCRVGGPPEFPVNCPGPCDANFATNQAIHTITRGQSLTVNWPRNNHPGGFIRLSWISANTPETHENFDNGAQSYYCHEVGCQADAGAGVDGGDSNGSDGTKNPCTLTTTVPTHLADGRWTMQWSWYGATGGYLGDYYTCVNFNVAGGVAVTARQPPTFKGGDVSNPGRGDLCEFSNTNKLHYCWKEPCGDICDVNTSPTGHCGWPPGNGRPHIPALDVLLPMGTCKEYTATDLPKAFPKPSSTINVPDSFNVQRVWVNRVTGTNARAGDLSAMYLESPAGNRISLLHGVTTNAETTFSLSFNDTARATRWTSNGTWKPVDALTWFNNVPSRGDWKLIVESRSTSTRGTLNGWSITLCQAPTVPVPTSATPTSRAPATTAVVTPTSPPSGEVPQIAVKVTVTLPMAPGILDITTFIYDMIKVLDLPLLAMQQVVVDLDRSTSTLTYVQFQIINALKKDGTRVDPVKAAEQLRAKAKANDQSIQESLMLPGMEVVGTEELNAQENAQVPFTQTSGFVALVAVLGGVVLVAIIATVVGLVVYRKKKYGAWY